ncbi:hypothetical protein EV421DRAFT_1910137 [Armillaria borealis]|uniref:Uncharacterized protein n=1 Tax=Armillaria borealis TaxID=47425 RepID=A0AA39IZP0_9AGAR|nr:hypothetical protein EV421DRAFT_1910137 [Armillaria borealis]
MVEMRIFFWFQPPLPRLAVAFIAAIAIFDVADAPQFSLLLTMPTQVQTRSSDTLPRGPEGLDAHSFQHDNEQANKIIHMQHKEALRLALGSILSPKRPPNSRSTSGTASPAHIYYTTHPHSPYPPPPPPHSTPAQAESTSHYLFPPQGHLISHSHTPSRLCQSDSATDYLSSSQPSPRSSPGPDSPLAPPSPTSTGSPAIHAPAPGTGTPNKAKFIETLQSKSAWDALIHGPFS